MSENLSWISVHLSKIFSPCVRDWWAVVLRDHFKVFQESACLVPFEWPFFDTLCRVLGWNTKITSQWLMDRQLAFFPSEPWEVGISVTKVSALGTWWTPKSLCYHWKTSTRAPLGSDADFLNHIVALAIITLTLREEPWWCSACGRPPRYFYFTRYLLFMWV